MTATIRPNVNYGNRELALRGEILRGLVGSTVHGTNLEGTDDIDQMGIYVPPASHVAGLGEADTHVWRTQPEGARSGPGDIDLTIYTLRHWTRLAVAGNPSILTLLFVPEADLIVRTPFGDRLRDAAPLILSKQAGQRFLGYLHGQRERMLGGGKQNRVPNRPELIERYGFDVKYAGHAVRLALQGIELMTQGRIQLPMPDAERETVLAVRRGEMPFEQVLNTIDAYATVLTKYVEGEFPSPLPERPDMDAVNRLLVELHSDWWESSQHLPTP